MAESAWRQMESAVANRENELGSGEVQKLLDTTLGLLADGRYDESAAQSTVTGQLLSKWQNAQTVYLEAERATRKARQEGRTSGLDGVEAGLAGARAALISGQFDNAATLSYQTLQEAEQLNKPLNGVIVLVGAALCALAAVWFYRKRVRARRASA